MADSDEKGDKKENIVNKNEDKDANSAFDAINGDVNTKQQGLNNDAAQSCIKYLTDVFSENFSHKGFNMNEYIYIHGGTCRDSITGKPIKDIDLSVDLHKIHLHAASCKNNSCRLHAEYMKNFKHYQEITRIKQEEDRLNKFLTSEFIINTGYLLGFLKQNSQYSQYCSSIKGPNCYSKNLITYQIYFSNGIDFDIMDCSCYLFWDMDPGGKQGLPNQIRYVTHFKNEPIYPITHIEHCKRTDVLFNALYIPLANIVAVPLSKWAKYVIDPFAVHKELQIPVKVSALDDLRNGVLRPMFSMSGNQLALIARNLSSIGQGEFIVFRTIKNAYKLKGKPIIYIDHTMQQATLRAYITWFYPDTLLKNKRLQSLLRHAFAHNYFKKIDQDTIVGMYHLLGYDGQLLYWYKHHNVFKKELDKAVEKYNANGLWKRIKEAAASRMQYYLEAQQGCYDSRAPIEYKTKSCTFKVNSQDY